MSIEPPKSGSGIPGPMILLGFASVLLLVLMAIFGMLAFGIDLPGTGGNDETDAPESITDLEPSGFNVVSTGTEGEQTVIEADVIVTNTSDAPIENAQIIVQCEDNGYVSAIADVPPLDPAADTSIRMELHGRGEPSCDDPVISFSPRREGS